LTTEADKQFTVTFITPHQKSTSGGVYVISEFARHMSASIRVNLVVRQGEPQVVGDAILYSSPGLNPAELPDADAILLNADSKDCDAFASLPESKGQKIIFLQGFGTPGNPRVIENLKRGHHVIANATWLVDEARRYGCPAAYVSAGLDSSFFHLGDEADRNPLLVSMLSHTLDWKGGTDGLAAIEIVRAAYPGLEVTMFGGHRDERAAPWIQFLERPDRKGVGDLLRKSSVFLCSSWEEGFGLPGLEALACGASLATTDTKGSRDYAMHGKSALVSPPKQPEILAENLMRLLGSAELRSRLTSGFNSDVAPEFTDWPRAAQRFAGALRSFQS
jgi:glycosyltransferase involved in cell wall biosynthesis